MAPAVTVPSITPWTAVTIHVTGLARTKASSQPGIVAGSTITFEAKTRGNNTVKPSVITVVGVRTSRRRTMKHQPKPKPTASRTRNAPTTPIGPASAR